MAAPSTDAAETLRAALARTRAAGTARLVFIRNVTTLGVDEILEKSGQNRAARVLRAAKVLGERGAKRLVDALPSPAGVIDFAQQRSLYPGGGGCNLTTPTAEYNGEPGEWELEIWPGDLLGDNEPFWLLALLDGLVDAQSRGETHLRGERCSFYTASARASRAADASGRHLAPLLVGDVDPERMALEVWLDAQSRVRRIVLALGVRQQQIVELWDFGVPAPIDLPPDAEVVETYDPSEPGPAT